MKPIYLEILSEGENGVSQNSGENAKGENLGLIAGAELYRMVSLFPEMLEMLVVVKGVIETQICEREMKNVEQFCIEDLDNIRNLIAKAEGHE